MKVLFMGTPAFAVPSLERLIASNNHEVVGVVTQPDRALKRGKVELSDVKLCAQRFNLPVFQPEKISDDIDTLKSLGADIAVTAAYGQLLTQAVLDAFPNGIINVHASLLPKYRGASPIYSAIADGQKVTGVTIMRTELGLDTGDILSKVETGISDNDTAGTLTARLADLGANLLVDTLDSFDKINPTKQDDSQATRCRTIKKQEEYIDFSLDAQAVYNKIRALNPLPCAKTVIDGEVYKIHSAVVDSDDGKFGEAGEIINSDGKIVIACGVGTVKITVIQAPSKRAMRAQEYLLGNKLNVGTVCGAYVK